MALAAESCLRMDKRAARIASTQADEAAKEIASNELFRMLQQKRLKKSSSASFWLDGTLVNSVLCFSTAAVFTVSIRDSYSMWKCNDTCHCEP